MSQYLFMLSYPASLVKEVRDHVDHLHGCETGGHGGEALDVAEIDGDAVVGLRPHRRPSDQLHGDGPINTGEGVTTHRTYGSNPSRITEVMQGVLMEMACNFDA